MRRLFLKNRTITTELPAFVMGIVNVTPDSFWSGSRGDAERALSLVADGADILDIGGESTRPGSDYVSAEEEVRRIVPVIEEIRRKSDVPISVDTRKKSVMEAALAAGADMLNDISALEDDPEMASFCAASGIPVVLMHKRGLPSDMQDDTAYTDVFSEVDAYLSARVQVALDAGIPAEKIIVDPGVGFGKDTAGNAALIKNAGVLCGGKYMVLMALSRKSCIGQMTGRAVEERLAGTLAADLVSIMGGAGMVRVHDVRETVDTLKVLGYINRQ